MSDLIERGGIPEGYKVKVFDGRVIMTARSPEQYWTVSDVKAAVKRAGITRERVFGGVLITFPGENDAAPDLTIVGFGAERRKNGYSCIDVLAVVEVPSEAEDEKDYVRNVQKYARYGIDFYMIADPFKNTVTDVGAACIRLWAGCRDRVRPAGPLHSGHRGAREDRHQHLSQP